MQFQHIRFPIKDKNRWGNLSRTNSDMNIVIIHGKSFCRKNNPQKKCSYIWTHTSLFLFPLVVSSASVLTITFKYLNTMASKLWNNCRFMHNYLKGIKKLKSNINEIEVSYLEYQLMKLEVSSTSVWNLLHCGYADQAVYHFHYQSFCMEPFEGKEQRNSV